MIIFFLNFQVTAFERVERCTQWIFDGRLLSIDSLHFKSRLISYLSHIFPRLGFSPFLSVGSIYDQASAIAPSSNGPDAGKKMQPLHTSFGRRRRGIGHRLSQTRTSRDRSLCQKYGQCWLHRPTVIGHLTFLHLLSLLKQYSLTNGSISFPS